MTREQAQMSGGSSRGRTIVGEPPHSAAEHERGRRSLGPLFWLLCLLVTPFVLVWNVWTLSVNAAGPYFDECPLLANAVLCLLVLVGLNTVLRRVATKWALSRAELLLLYTVLTIVTAVGGSWYGQGLAMVIAYPFWFGNVADQSSAALYDWGGFLGHLPSWLVVSDGSVLRGFWSGDASVLDATVLRAWATPLLAWSGFVVCLFLLTMCLNVLVRRHWVNDERLTFPIVWLPLSMTEDSGALFRSRLMWIGFAGAFATQIVNGLNYFYPGLPVVPTKYRPLMGLFPDAPWNAMDALTISFHPMMVGLGYLLPQDLLFASWFFHLYWQCQRVAAAALGFSPERQQAGFPYVQDQSFGAAIALGLVAVWSTRTHLRMALSTALRRDPCLRPDDSREAFSYRIAFIGVVVCLLAVLGFMVLSGMSVAVALIMLCLQLTLLVAVTRIRAESGGPLIDMFRYFNPAVTMTHLAGSRPFSVGNLTAMSLHSWHLSAGFNQPMPYGLEALRTADETRRAQRRFFVAAVAAAAIGMVGTLAVELLYAYSWGEAAGFNKTEWGQARAWSMLDSWVTERTTWNPGAVAGALAGAATTIFLAVMRTRWVGWPFHPVPYALTAGWGVYMGFFWFPFFVAWVAKSVIIRYWGLTGFRVALPFCLGLIMGEMAGGMLWPLYGMLTGTQCYSFFGA